LLKALDENQHGLPSKRLSGTSFDFVVWKNESNQPHVSGRTLKTKAGHQRIVRHGHLPEREIMTGIGSVAVRQPRVRDREAVVNGFASARPFCRPTPGARRASKC
jgi:hypothetical protein